MLENWCILRGILMRPFQRIIWIIVIGIDPIPLRRQINCLQISGGQVRSMTDCVFVGIPWSNYCILLIYQIPKVFDGIIYTPGMLLAYLSCLRLSIICRTYIWTARYGMFLSLVSDSPADLVTHKYLDRFGRGHFMESQNLAFGNTTSWETLRYKNSGLIACISLIALFQVYHVRWAKPWLALYAFQVKVSSIDERSRRSSLHCISSMITFKY